MPTSSCLPRGLPGRPRSPPRRRPEAHPQPGGRHRRPWGGRRPGERRPGDHVFPQRLMSWSRDRGGQRTQSARRPGPWAIASGGWPRGSSTPVGIVGTDWPSSRPGSRRRGRRWCDMLACRKGRRRAHARYRWKAAQLASASGMSKGAVALVRPTEHHGHHAGGVLNIPARSPDAPGEPGPSRAGHGESPARHHIKDNPRGSRRR